MRELLSQLIVENAEKSTDFVVLSGDHGYALFDAIRTRRPDQFINVGVIEQTMVGLAAGLAKTGHRPLVYGLSAFVPIRVLEQIKIDICHPGLPVILIGDGAGLVYSTLGVSHQCGEDLACLTPLPGMTIYSPADREELRVCFSEALAGHAPAYVRIGKSDRGEIHSPGSLRSTAPRRVVEAASGPSASRGVLVSMGPILVEAARIARDLGLDCVSVPKLKPFPAAALMELLRGYSWIGVVEEHHRFGGLFSMLAQTWALEGGPPVKWKSFSLEDRFTHTAGSYQHAMSEHQLSDPQLRARIQEALT